MKCTAISFLAAGTAALAVTSAAAQPMGRHYDVRVALAPGWSAAAPEGQCRLRVWVDDLARVAMRGDRVVIRTDAGERSYDLGSACDHPLPFGRVTDLQVRGERARGLLLGVEPPARRNDYTTAFTIHDPQRGGDEYDVVLEWRNPDPIVAPVAVGPAPWMDEARACQERVSDEFFARNPGSATYLQFATGASASLDAGFGRNRIRGAGLVRDHEEAWPMAYECVVNEAGDSVLIAAYEVDSRGRSLL
jgi:hypothetical protein